MKLPKLYAPTKIKFWSLRNGLGDGLGVVFDIDTKVERICARVRIEGGWKWQIINARNLCEHDYFIETDQETLDEYGDHAEFEVSE